MAHFAKIDENNTVTQVIVVHNNELLENGVENELKGIAFCQSLFGGNWKQTSYNGTMRKNFAGVGYTYDQTRDAFIPPKPYNSWLLDETTCTWSAPVAHPSDGKIYIWDEAVTNWVEVI